MLSGRKTRPVTRNQAKVPTIFDIHGVAPITPKEIANAAAKLKNMSREYAALNDEQRQQCLELWVRQALIQYGLYLEVWKDAQVPYISITKSKKQVLVLSGACLESVATAVLDLLNHHPLISRHLVDCPFLNVFEGQIIVVFEPFSLVSRVVLGLGLGARLTKKAISATIQGCIAEVAAMNEHVHVIGNCTLPPFLAKKLGGTAKKDNEWIISTSAGPTVHVAATASDDLKRKYRLRPALMGAIIGHHSG